MSLKLIPLAIATIAAPLAAADGPPDVSAPAPAPAPAAVAAAFGARPDIQQISLSPDGTHIAIISPTKGRGAALLIADVVKGGPPKGILQTDGKPQRLTDCAWTTNVRLVCGIYIVVPDGRDNMAFTRLIAIDSDGSDMKLLSARTDDRSLRVMQAGGSIIDLTSDGGEGSVLLTRDYVPQSTTGSMLGDTRSGYGVERVDTVSLSRKMVEAPRSDADTFISDGQGRVRVMGIQPKASSGYDRNIVNYYYRKPGARDWLTLGTVTIGAGVVDGFEPEAVDPGLNVVYGYDADKGHRTLSRISLDGSLKREQVFARNDVDVAGLVKIGRQQRVVGISFITDRRQTEFFDPALKTLRVALGKALPKTPLITFVDASADESKLLLFAASDVNPGRYYLYDKATHQLGEIAPDRPQLAATTLAAVKAITYPAADGTPIPAYLTLPPGSDGRNLPAIVMPHGGPGSRDEWGFDWLAQFFVARGFAVLQPNYRGSTGYGEAWFEKNGFQSWKTAIGDVNDAGRYLEKAGIAAPGKLAIVGWSYGGYAALQSAVLDPDLFKAIVAIAPVTDLETLREESRYFTNYKLVDGFIGRGAHLREGSPAQNVARIKAPVLLFHGDRDRNVGVGESRMMASRLKGAGKQVSYVEFHDLDHQLEDGGTRTEMLEKSDAFLRASLGIK